MGRTIARVLHAGAPRRWIVLLVVGFTLLAGLAAVRLPFLAGWSGPSSNPQPAYPDGWAASFSRDVAPLLARGCVRCHGPQQADKGLRLDSYQRVMAGDSYGTVVIPGGSPLSAIVSVIKYGTMPHGAGRLTPAEIETISLWIDSGAPDN